MQRVRCCLVIENRHTKPSGILEVSVVARVGIGIDAIASLRGGLLSFRDHMDAIRGQIQRMDVKLESAVKLFLPLRLREVCRTCCHDLAASAGDVDTLDMIDFEQELWLQSPANDIVLSIYLAQDIEARKQKNEYDGWFSRLDDHPEISPEELTTAHGNLIALGYLKVDVGGRTGGVRYQVTSAARRQIEGVAFEDDGSSADVGSLSDEEPQLQVVRVSDGDEGE